LGIKKVACGLVKVALKELRAYFEGSVMGYVLFVNVERNK
jgi:hypothetical protein